MQLELDFPRKDDNKEVSELIYRDKYLQTGESFKQGMSRLAAALTDNKEEFYTCREILTEQRFLPAGRIQASIGSMRATTPYNCFVSCTISDSMKGITRALSESLETLRLGGGIGYDFSTIRPSGSRITTLDSTACGPVGNGVGDNRGFMDLFDAGCAVIRSAGHRRGAQMGVLRVDHPDVQHFISAKREAGRLTNFNVSLAVTDKFMECVKTGEPFPLVFDGRVYEWINAKNLWQEIMRSTWDHAEPGVLFIDRINKKNNLHYCENIVATNPCGEQPLPPYGACLLGSLNLVKYIKPFGTNHHVGKTIYKFDYELFKRDITYIVPMMDRVIDEAIYPLEEQRKEAQRKRRMGLGVTGLADALAMLGVPYGSDDSFVATAMIMETLRNTAYLTSCRLAAERGPFELLDTEKYLESAFAKTLPEHIRGTIREVGIRNSHLLSVAPTGTISLAADNVSSGIEPPYQTGHYKRKIIMGSGEVKEYLMADYITANHPEFSKYVVDASSLPVVDHVDMLNLVSHYVDSSVSKTCNVGDDVTFDEFVDVYMRAYRGGASGCTTFREAGFREGIMSRLDTEKEAEASGAACYFDPETGQKSCE